MIKAIIFDLDEVLVDNVKNHLQANTEALKEFAGDNYISEGKNNYIGMRIKDSMKLRMKHLNIDDSLFEKIYKKRMRIFIELVKKNCPALPGVNHITTLATDLKLKKAIATSGTREYANECINQLNLENFFDCVLTGEDVEKGKPNPEVYINTVKQLELSPEECVVLEDAKNGVVAAKNAGTKCIGVHYPRPKGQEQDLSNADFETHSLIQINKQLLSHI